MLTLADVCWLPELGVVSICRALSGVSPSELYDRLETLRSAFNKGFQHRFELYLEDEWNEYVEGETWLDYRLRSLRTLDEFPKLASDAYLNHQDAGGVWHLGSYQCTHVHFEDTLERRQALHRFLESHRYDER
jgi:hypothetical protein